VNDSRPSTIIQEHAAQGSRIGHDRQQAAISFSKALSRPHSLLRWEQCRRPPPPPALPALARQSARSSNASRRTEPWRFQNPRARSGPVGTAPFEPSTPIQRPGKAGQERESIRQETRTIRAPIRMATPTIRARKPGDVTEPQVKEPQGSTKARRRWPATGTRSDSPGRRNVTCRERKNPLIRVSPRQMPLPESTTARRRFGFGWH